MQIADRMDQISFSGIRKMLEEVGRREQAGQEIVHLEIGRPDFDTPAHIKKAAVTAIETGKVHYTSNYGLIELRRAIAAKLETDNGLQCDPESELMVTAGAIEAVFLAMISLLNPGDEVLIPDPCWPVYAPTALMASAVPVAVETKEENGFVPSIETMERHINGRTRLLVINSPNNPTGAVYSADFLGKVAELACKHDLMVLSDEIYEKIIYDGHRHHSIANWPGMSARTITVNGLSKVYAMTDWRIGYVAAPAEVIGAMVRIHQNTHACATSFAQWGAVAALTGPNDDACNMVAEFKDRRDFMVESINAMPGVHVLKPQGAFYLFVNIADLKHTSDVIALALLDQARIAVVPGASFGEFGSQHLRLSYANSMQNLQTAAERMTAALQQMATD